MLAPSGDSSVSEAAQQAGPAQFSEIKTSVTNCPLSLGEEIRHRALPTFSDILHTLAPPIASHERLSIHVTHDIVGYPSLDPLVYAVFSHSCFVHWNLVVASAHVVCRVPRRALLL